MPDSNQYPSEIGLKTGNKKIRKNAKNNLLFDEMGIVSFCAKNLNHVDVYGFN